MKDENSNICTEPTVISNCVEKLFQPAVFWFFLGGGGC
jgi:hypothetical protein